MMLLGIDVGSSSVKLSVLEVNKGEVVASAQYPSEEMKMISVKAGWAEQSPSDWWANIKLGLEKIKQQVKLEDIKAIGITYQMHGLVCVDKDKNVLRPSIIWCDSRAVEIGNKAFEEIGASKCLSHLFNSPGNFTASKLKWVKDNEPELFAKIDKIMLPGDFVAMKLTGEITTTVSGLSEGIFWDYQDESVAGFLMDYYGFSTDLIPRITNTFGNQGQVSASAAAELGLPVGIPVTYRAGDQPNNAFSLNVLNPGEIAATAGTSGVVYGVSDKKAFDPQSRVNAFAHVNHSGSDPRYGILLCINGTGILNSWLRQNVAIDLDYIQMNELASGIAPGSDGLVIVPFGNGAERVIENKNPGSSIHNLNFNTHTRAHLLRAAQEGIAFSFKYGIDIMKQKNGIQTKLIKAGKANMFLSNIFRDTLVNTLQVPVELYDTDGSAGAARGAGVGAGIYSSFAEAFESLKVLSVIEPQQNLAPTYREAYSKWEQIMNKTINY